MDQRFGKFVRGTSKTPFDSHDEAAISALFKAVPLTFFTQHEWGGFTESRNEQYFFTDPTMGGRSSWLVVDSRGEVPVGLSTGETRIYHTHPLVPENVFDLEAWAAARTFSVADMSQASRVYPEVGHNYMGNPYGDFLHGSGQIFMLDINMVMGDFEETTIPGGPSNEEYFQVLECIGAGYILR